MTITIELLLSLITAFAPTHGSAADLCDTVNPDTGVPLMCEAHAEGAPVYDGDLCCKDDACVPAGPVCPVESLRHCDLGEVRADDTVACYFEIPNYCDIYPCEPGYGSQPQASTLCCNQGVCWPTSTSSNDCELEDLVWCDSAVSNPDGTASCVDDE